MRTRALDNRQVIWLNSKVVEPAKAYGMYGGFSRSYNTPIISYSEKGFVKDSYSIFINGTAIGQMLGITDTATTRADMKIYAIDNVAGTVKTEEGDFEYDLKLSAASGKNSMIVYYRYPRNVKLDEFSTEQKAVADRLIQKLSVIRHELWYDYNYGLPLLQKGLTKGMLDAKMIEIITADKDVESIVSFSSKVEKNAYSAKITIKSICGDVIFDI